MDNLQFYGVFLQEHGCWAKKNGNTPSWKWIFRFIL